jgi:hypothetical protein
MVSRAPRRRSPPRGPNSSWASRRSVRTGASAKAYRSTLAAAERHGSLADAKARVRQLVAAEGASERFVTQVLGRELAL